MSSICEVIGSDFLQPPQLRLLKKSSLMGVFSFSLMGLVANEVSYNNPNALRVYPPILQTQQLAL